MWQQYQSLQNLCDNTLWDALNGILRGRKVMEAVQTKEYTNKLVKRTDCISYRHRVPDNLH